MMPEERAAIVEVVARSLAFPNIGKVSEYWRIKAEAAVEVCLPAAYEDAARIAERWGEAAGDDLMPQSAAAWHIAAAIRARKS
jgi:hypothetical protein